tara:strand:- start:4991 stop:6424 length:1434 start_codon:yes stop_codon:yes gene_type:complete
MKHIRLAELIDQPKKYDTVTAKGWVRTFRAKRFIALNDGSTSENLQCVVDFENTDEDILKKINTGAAIEISGKLVESIGRGQSLEIIVDNIKIIGEAHPELYPIQPKKHSFEFLREKAHLRVRTATFSAVMRIRSELSFAIHQFFHDKGFYHINTPIITGSDSEGAGEIFRVSVLDPKNPPVDHVGEVDFKQDFFGKQTYLTVSGQLEAETYAQGLGNVYTFGPTFRAENSNTSRHLAEFWMIEPEMAFYELEDNMDLSEEFIKYTLKYILEKCKKDLSFLDQRLANEEKTKSQNQRSQMGLLEKINFVVNNEFKRVTYTEAIEILKNSKLNKKKKFDYLVDEWGAEIQSEHERYLVEKHFNTPVILYDYPAKIKSFYMRMNDDQKTVRAMDVLFPGVGEIVGGSQREERLNVLEKRIEEMGIDAEELWWYLDLRRFGTTPHSGFGLGFERLVLFATGMSNIRDVIPFPRTPQNGSF